MIMKTIKSNCAIKIYLKSDSPKTMKKISDYLGKCCRSDSASANASLNKVREGSVSNSGNLGGRELLIAGRNDSYYCSLAVVMESRYVFVGVRNAASLSQYKLISYGLGDEAHNTKLIAARESERPERKNIGSVPL